MNFSGEEVRDRVALLFLLQGIKKRRVVDVFEFRWFFSVECQGAIAYEPEGWRIH